MLRATTTRWFWTIFFLSLQVLVLVRNWVTDYWVFYWFCDFAPGLFALFFALGKTSWVKGLLNIGLLGQGLYLLSFASALLLRIPLFGFPIDLRSGAFNLTITFFMHCSALVAWYATREIKPNANTLAASAIILTLMYCAVLIGTEPETAMDWNFNYIYTSPLSPFIPHYTALWIAISFCIVVVPSHMLQCIWFDLTHQPKTPRQHQAFFTKIPHSA